MNFTQCYQAAHHNLANCRCSLTSGQADHRVAAALRDAILWSMEGWLIAASHRLEHRHGWRDTREAFQKFAPLDLHARLTSFLAESTSLEMELSEKPGTMQRCASPTECLALAWSLLERVESSLEQLCSGIKEVHENGKNFRSNIIDDPEGTGEDH